MLHDESEDCNGCIWTHNRSHTHVIIFPTAIHDQNKYRETERPSEKESETKEG